MKFSTLFLCIFTLLSLFSCSGGTDYENSISDSGDWYFYNDKLHFVLEKKKSRLNYQLEEVVAAKSVIFLSVSFEDKISIDSMQEEKVGLVRLAGIYGLDLQKNKWIRKGEISWNTCDQSDPLREPIHNGMMATFCHLSVNIFDIYSKKIIRSIDISLIRPWLDSDWKDDMFGSLSQFYRLAFLSNGNLIVFPVFSKKEKYKTIYIDVRTGTTEVNEFDIQPDLHMLDAKLVDGKISFLAAAKWDVDGEKPVYIIEPGRKLTKVFDNWYGSYLWVPEKKLIFHQEWPFETRPDVIKMPVTKYDYDKNIRVNGMLILPNKDPANHLIQPL
ncbi:MAG TPA: hypothetical protein DCS87_06015 [Rheinheimera sp.]|nr:hypothetical protein [Rheinheimera sp.]